MRKNRDRNNAELQEGDGLVRTTVVGGQPRKRPTIRMSIRVGLERVLYRASVDRAFRKALLKDREGALKAAGMELSSGEAAVLASVDRDALATLIDNVRPEARKDHRFVKAVAATFVTLATGTTACDIDSDNEPTRGITTEVKEPYPDMGVTTEVKEPYPDMGVTTDVSIDFSAGDSGIVEDVPEPFPDPGISSDFPVIDDTPAVDLDVSETSGSYGIQPDAVEVDVAQPMEDGSSADVIEKPAPPGKK